MYRETSQTFSNLWVIRLDAEGGCTEFTDRSMASSRPPALA